MPIHYDFRPERHADGRGYTCRDHSGRATWATGPGRSCGWYKYRHDAAARCEVLNAEPIQGHVFKPGLGWVPVVFENPQEFALYAKRERAEMPAIRGW